MKAYILNDIYEVQSDIKSHTHTIEVLKQLTEPILNIKFEYLQKECDFNKIEPQSLLILLFSENHRNSFLDHPFYNHLIKFVDDGGSLLISLCQNASHITHRILENFNVIYDPEKLCIQLPNTPWILGTNLIVSAKNKIVYSEILVHDSGSFKTANEDYLLDFNGKGLACIDNYGKGMLAVLADTKIIDSATIGAKDNFRLWLEIVAKLLKKPLTLEHLKKGESLLKQDLKCISPTSNSDECIIDCSKHQENFQSLACEIPYSPYKNREEFIQESLLKYEDFPKDMRYKINKFRNSSNNKGYILLRGLPTDVNLCNTPQNTAEAPDKKTFMSEFYLSAVGSALGDVFTFIQEKGGNMFQNICPTPQNTYNISSESSEIYLDFHTEIAFHPVTTDFLMLYCLRSDHEEVAATLVFSIDDLVPFMPRKYYSVLFEEQFRTGIDYSFGSPNGLKANGPVVSVLSGDKHQPYFRCDFDLMIGLTPLANDALNYLRKNGPKMSSKVYLKPGDLLIVDNNKAMHGRTFFKARYDGCDRWLQRALVTKDLSLHKRSMPIWDRTVTLKFAA